MKAKIALVSFIAILASLFFYLDLHHYADLQILKAQQDAVARYNAAHPWHAAFIFFGGYILITCLSLPGAALMTLAGGAIFGLLIGAVMVSFASTIGATLAFLSSRYLFRAALQKKFADKLTELNNGIEQDGAFYLFAMRLVPIFPFFVINLLMGLTPIKTATFFFISQIGMLPGTLLYVYAGTQLAGITALEDILSPQLLIAFTLIGLFPLLAKKTLAMLQARWRRQAPSST